MAAGLKSWRSNPSSATHLLCSKWITCLRHSFLNYKIIIRLPVRIIRRLMKWGMWRLPGNTCFEKANIYPHVGKNPRQIPRDNPAALACSLWSIRGGGKAGGLLQARRLIGLLCIPNKLSNDHPVFNTPPPPLSGTESPSTRETTYQQKTSSELIFGGKCCQHFLYPVSSSMLLKQEFKG